MPMNSVSDVIVRRTGDRIALPAGAYSCQNLYAGIREMGCQNYAAEYFLDNCMSFDLFVPGNVVAVLVEVMVLGRRLNISAEFLDILKAEGLGPLPHAAGPLLRVMRKELLAPSVLVVTAQQGVRFIIWRLGQTPNGRQTFSVVENSTLRGIYTMALQDLRAPMG